MKKKTNMEQIIVGLFGLGRGGGFGGATYIRT